MLIAVKLRALVLHGRVCSLIGYWEKGLPFFFLKILGQLKVRFR